MSRSRWIVLEVTIVPETQIIAPRVSEEQLRRWVANGWIDEEVAEHIDRAFPRNADGKPVLLRMWLRAALRRACDVLGYPQDVKNRVLSFSIVDERGVPVEYIVIPDKPLVYTRPIIKQGKQSTETYEYIDSTYRLKFMVAVPEEVARQFVEALEVAGRIGIMAKTKHGYGKFRVLNIKTLNIEPKLIY